MIVPSPRIFHNILSVGNPGEDAGSVEFEQYVGVAFFEFGIAVVVGGGVGLGPAGGDVVQG